MAFTLNLEAELNDTYSVHLWNFQVVKTSQTFLQVNAISVSMQTYFNFSSNLFWKIEATCANSAFLFLTRTKGDALWRNLWESLLGILLGLGQWGTSHDGYNYPGLVDHPFWKVLVQI